MKIIFKILTLSLFFLTWINVASAYDEGLSFGQPIVDAADAGNEYLVMNYIRNGVSPNTKGEFNTTALMRASYRGDEVLVRNLLESGANVHAKDLGGATALHLAARAGHKGIVQLLMKYGGSSEVEDNEGYSPIKRAILAQDLSVIDTMIKRGSDLDHKGTIGISARELANKSSNKRILALMPSVDEVEMNVMPITAAPKESVEIVDMRVVEAKPLSVDKVVVKQPKVEQKEAAKEREIKKQVKKPKEEPKKEPAPVIEASKSKDVQKPEVKVEQAPVEAKIEPEAKPAVVQPVVKEAPIVEIVEPKIEPKQDIVVDEEFGSIEIIAPEVIDVKEQQPLIEIKPAEEVKPEIIKELIEAPKPPPVEAVKPEAIDNKASPAIEIAPSEQVKPEIKAPKNDGKGVQKTGAITVGEAIKISDNADIKLDDHPVKQVKPQVVASPAHDIIKPSTTIAQPKRNMAMEVSGFKTEEDALLLWQKISDEKLIPGKKAAIISNNTSSDSTEYKLRFENYLNSSDVFQGCKKVRSADPSALCYIIHNIY